MQSNLLMYLTAMSAVSLHNLVSNINEATRSYDLIQLKTSDTNFTLDEDLKKTYVECGGERQSPININTLNTKENLNLRLGLTAYDKPISGLLINQFPTFQLVPFSFEWPRPNALVTSSLARSFNAQPESHFILHYVQFYWSHDDATASSVHQIDNQTYTLEIHFMHFNSAYRTLEEAFSKPDGMLIFAVMTVASTHESYIFDKFLNELSNITVHGQQILIDEDTTWRSLLPVDTSRFYRYQGSMILPPCHQSVQWIIFEDKLRLGYKQLKRLKQYQFLSKDLRNNREIDWTAQRRPMQEINGRVVEQSFRRDAVERKQIRLRNL